MTKGDYADLERLLREYGRHTQGCSAELGEQYRCRCGWREVVAELQARGLLATPLESEARA